MCIRDRCIVATIIGMAATQIAFAKVVFDPFPANLIKHEIYTSSLNQNIMQLRAYVLLTREVEMV